MEGASLGDRVKGKRNSLTGGISKALSSASKEVGVVVFCSGLSLPLPPEPGAGPATENSWAEGITD